MNTQNELIRNFTEKDQLEIIKLHHDVFKSNLDQDKWKWQFLSHPKGNSWITLAIADNDIVGQYAVMRNHLNFLGREIVAGQSCDTMVKSDQRGKRWFTKLADYNYAYLSENRVNAVFGFPNRNSYPGFMKYLKWVRLFNLTNYQYRIGVRNLLGRGLDWITKEILYLFISLKLSILYKPWLKNHSFSTGSFLPVDLSGFFKEINDYEVLSVWKDETYFKWRYIDKPHHNYLFHTLKIEGSVESLVVTREVDNMIKICEIFDRTKDPIKLSSLLLYIIKSYARRKLQKIEFYGHDYGFFDSVFQRCGFIRRTSNIVFGGRVFENTKLNDAFIMPNNWTVSYGDTDAI